MKKETKPPQQKPSAISIDVIKNLFGPNSYIPKEFNISRSELYVIDGDALTKLYNLLFNQRAMIANILSLIPPNQMENIELYMVYLMNINQLMFQLCTTVTTTDIINSAMPKPADVTAVPTVEKKTEHVGVVKRTMNDILKSFRIANSDDTDTPENPADISKN